MNANFTFLLRGLLVMACMVCLPSRADEQALRKTVDTQVLPLMAEHGVPGVAVAVISHGKTSFYNYGLASLDPRAAVTENTLFEIGSVSKTFTATLASYAQVTGQLSLADHPGKTMPQLAGTAIDAASLLELGTFTAGGLPLQFPDEVVDDASMVAYLRQWQPLAQPGQVRRYSNPSIGLLGHVTALALGRDYAGMVEKKLFPELGMQYSHIRVPGSAMPKYAWGYKEGKPVRVNPGQLDAEAYGVKSTARDMIRFVAANIDPSGLKTPLRRAIEGTHVGYFQTGVMVQGLGWEQYPYPVTLDDLQAGNATDMSMKSNPTQRLDPPRTASEATLFNKTGSTNGFGAYAVFVPSTKTGIVLLANKNFPIAARIKAVHAILEQAVR